jgi:branched-subunit amino acid transport protein
MQKIRELDMYITLVILGMGLCTFLPRYLPLVLFRNKELPVQIKQVLSHVPPAVLAAIVFPSLLVPVNNVFDPSWNNPYLLSGVITIIATILSKRMVTSAMVGMCCFYLMLHYFPR